jgi:hypothetical protein
MKNTNIRAESLAGIMIWVFILSIVLLGIGNMISFSNNSTEAYQENSTLELLKTNTDSIIRKVDTSHINAWERFFLYKDNVNKNFVVGTGATYEPYTYIDSIGNHIADPINYVGDVYSRILFVERYDKTLETNNQVIRVSIKKLIKK